MNQRRSECFRHGEPDKHRYSRYVIAKILQRQGYSIDFGLGERGYQLTTCYPPLDRPKNYTVDIYAWSAEGIKFYIEIDGDIHRRSKIFIDKTNKKHAQIKECLKIVLIHLEPDDIVGKYALSDVALWFEIEKQYYKGQQQLIFETLPR